MKVCLGMSECVSAYISKKQMSTSNIWQSNLPQNYDDSIKSYWNLTIWANLRLRFSRLHNSCSCDGYSHEVVTPVSYDVLNKLLQTALCNWYIFFPPIPSTFICIKSVTLKLEAVFSCETMDLTTLIKQSKNQKCNHHNEFSFHFCSFQYIF